MRTFGCQMNVKDSERIRGLLAQAGYEPAPRPSLADVIMVNTCSVREKPEQKVMGLLGRWKQIKNRRPGTIICVAGCVAQQMGRELLDRFPHLDVVMGTHMVHRAPELVERARSGERINAVERLDPGDPGLFRVPEVNPATRPSVFVSIMQGCSNACSYCIVPRVRGPAVFRPVQEVLEEAARLAGEGAAEITLLGQNANAYREGDVDFPDLLAKVADLPDVKRVRFTTSHPRDTGDKLINVMASHPDVMEHIHLPVQAGSDRVLSRMRRGYTREYYLGLVERLREVMPDVGITTDLIVGFPGETEADFEETLSLMNEVNFDETFSFRYSERPGTAATRFTDQVPEQEKYERLYRLQELQRKITEHKNERQVGRVQEVLVEGPSKTDPAKLTGRSRANRLVHFPDGGEAPGDVVQVLITRALKHSLEGEVKTLPVMNITAEEEQCLWR